MQRLTSALNVSSYHNEKGIVLTITLLFIMLFVTAAGYAVFTGYVQNKATHAVVGNRLKNYYRAQAGLVDARWRLYRNFTGGPPNLSPAPPSGGFNDPVAGASYSPNYTITSVDGTLGHDVKITIGPVDAGTGLRTITATSVGSD